MSNPERRSARERAALFLIPHLAAAWIRLTRLTTRLVRVNAGFLEECHRRRQPFVIAFWHGQLFLMRYAYPGRRIAILISAHRDGEFIRRTMERFGLTTVKGSTTRGGAAALRALVRRMREGFDAAFTPDGPRGPRGVVQPGVIAAARLSGAPIIPVAFACTKKNSFRPGIGF